MVEKANTSFSMKVVLLGESGVGKTSIINRYINSTYTDKLQISKSASFKAKYIHTPDPQTDVKMLIWDTAGQEIYRSLASFYYRDAEAALFVYDIMAPKSFEALSYWLGVVETDGPPDCLRTIVGNKCDCVAQELVAQETARSFALSHKASFFLISAKEDLGINEVFNDFCHRKYPKLMMQLDDTTVVSSATSKLGLKNGGKVILGTEKNPDKKSKSCHC